ncbi:MAG: helix-turn-helix transcriptional regulator [Deltaproteobacteria bacterium]|nr:helix-turn-helix transcriptional regulator [Deltaproteobacteria bacterium]
MISHRGNIPRRLLPSPEGIREVISGKRRFFELEYPCHSPGEERWFIGRVTSFENEVSRLVVIAHENITERKKAEKELHKAYDEIQDTNTALKVLLNKREKDQEEMEDKILTNYQSLIEPLLYRLKKTVGRNHHPLLDIIESNLSDMLSPFSQKLTDPLIQLTPKELQIASFIKQDYSNKEIAETFNCSVRTIHTHRNNIRNKLDIKNKKVNLKTYLMTFQ